MNNKKGQTTVFIIIAIIIVVSILGYFVVKGFLKGEVTYSQEEDLSNFIEGCLEEDIVANVNKISEQGGYLEVGLSKKFRFEGEGEYFNLAYLCYTQNDYIPCVNQEPVLIQHLRDEIHESISAKVEECFNELRDELERKDYVVESEYNGFEVEIEPKKVIVNLDGKITSTKNEETKTAQNFTSIVLSRIYDLAIVAQEIVYQEARLCNFDRTGFMLLYRDIDIDKVKLGDSTIIYRLTHEESEEKFQFAVRGCVIPPGA